MQAEYVRSYTAIVIKNLCRHAVPDICARAMFRIRNFCIADPGVYKLRSSILTLDAHRSKRLAPAQALTAHPSADTKQACDATAGMIASLTNRAMCAATANICAFPSYVACICPLCGESQPSNLLLNDGAFVTFVTVTWLELPCNYPAGRNTSL